MDTIEMARKGGRACYKKHGKKHMSKIGSLGATKRWKKKPTKKY